MTIPHTITNDSIIIIINGTPTTIQRGAPNFENLRRALIDKNWDEVPKHLSVASSVEAWSKGNFKFEGDTVIYKNEKMPEQFTQRMLAMVSAGESPESLMKFWEKLQQNPSRRSVEQLYPFLMHKGIPIQPNGNFLAYKGVNANYTDCHSGLVDNKPGTINEMARNKISDDPRVDCHYGYHVGALEYARTFGPVTIVCEVNPADVVCIPYDHDSRKMRVCKYRVIGNHNGEFLPSTAYDLEEVGAGTKVMVGEKEETTVVEEENTRLNSKEQDFVKAHLRVQAAKAIRARLGLGLKEAVDLINAYEASLKQPVQKQLKTQRDPEKRVMLKIPKQFREIHGMSMGNLMKQPLGTLRTYASAVLHIVGASKIPGGKTPLVLLIIKIRKNFKQ